MRALILLAACGLALGQAPDPAYEPLARAYDALRARDYDGAIAGFQAALAAAPGRASIRKDLGYAYLKIGENELARDQFGEAMAADPADAQVALEYAYLCYETKQRQVARRVFDRLRKAGNAAAEQAFQNIDAPLATGIERWKTALKLGGDSFSAQFELATLAEERDELQLAAEHYQKAWRILPDRRTVLVDLGRVWKALGRADDANAALLAASRGGEPRAAEMARELIPNRYPYVAEFRRALDLDMGSVELRRELAYLLLKMDRQPEAEREFRVLAETAGDLLSATQLGFLLFARGQVDLAMPLFDRVLAGPDEDLANRVRAVLRLPQLQTREPRPDSLDARVMAERSMKAGYIKDALKYLQIAHEADPADFGVVLKLGWAFNLLHQDRQALRWFDLARHSADPQISGEAGAAFRSLRPSTRRLRTSGWFYPTFSRRWRDLFAYGQVKTELRTPFPVKPYLSLRFIGDARRTIRAAGVSPLYLSESSVVLGLGLSTQVWRGVTAWAEAGSAVSYVTGHMVPDYRAGVSLARGAGSVLGGESSGWFGDTALDGIFASRYGNDFLLYQQNRAGYTAGRAQFYWNANLTVDSRGEAWANFVETGPGLRFTGPALPRSSYVTLDAVRGAYLKEGRAGFTDIRAGFWYAFTH